jgi:hypothetical protein
MIKKMDVMRLCVVLVLVIGAIGLAGCSAPVPKPDSQIALAETAINRAREVNANEYAPLELKFAEDKLKEAKEAVAKQDFEKARIKAEESAEDAKLAEAKSRSAKAKKITQDMQDDVDTLRKEVKRVQ